MKLPRFPSRLAGPALLFAVSVALCWKLVLTNQYTWLDGPDLAHQVLSWWVFQASEWHAGRFPLWDPHQWAGQSLIGQAQPGVAFPLNWLVFLMPLRCGWLRMDVLHWYFVVIHFIAALNMYALCRYLRVSRTAAVFGGVLFAFTGFIGTNDWPQMLNGAVWAPLVFLFLLRTVDGVCPWYSAACSGAFLGLSWLSGHHQIPTFLTLATIATWTFHIWRDRKLLRLAACAGIFTFLIGALQILPAYEYGKAAKRWVGIEKAIDWKQKVPYVVHDQYSFKAPSLYGLVFPSMSVHTNGFVGWVGMTLALFGLLSSFRETNRRLWVAIAVGGLLLALGSDSLLHGLVYALVTMVEKARSPSMAIFIFDFAIAVLAAYGVDSLGSHEHAVRRTWPVLCGVFAFVLLTGFVLAMFGKTLGNSRPMLSACVAGVMALLLYLLSREQISRKAFSALAFGLLLFEIPLVFGADLPNRYQSDREKFLNRLPEYQPFAEVLRARPDQPVRVFTDRVAIPYNPGDLYGIDHLDGYLASISSNLLDIDSGSLRGQELFATAYYVGKAAPSPKHQLVTGRESGLKLYFNPDALPRVRVIPTVRAVGIVDEVVAFIHDETKSLRDEVLFVGEAPQISPCQDKSGLGRIAQYTPSEVELEVFAPCKSVVVLADTWDRGWKATVDGHPARIWEAYGAMRAVVVEPGEHVIRMRYLPDSVVAGAAGLAIGLVGLIVLRLLKV